MRRRRNVRPENGSKGSRQTPANRFGPQDAFGHIERQSQREQEMNQLMAEVPAARELQRKFDATNDSLRTSQLEAAVRTDPEVLVEPLEEEKGQKSAKNGSRGTTSKKSVRGGDAH